MPCSTINRRITASASGERLDVAPANSPSATMSGVHPNLFLTSAFRPSRPETQ